MTGIYFHDTRAREGGGGSCSIKTMLDASDIQVLRQMFDEQEVRIDQKFEKRFVALDQKIDLFREGLDQKIDFVYESLDKKIGGVYESLNQKIDNVHVGLDQKIDRVRGELIATMEKGFSNMRDEILDVIEDNIQPQFNTLNARVTRLERKLA